MGILDGRVVIVTGGGRGLGREHCLAMAAEGAIVVVNDLGVGLKGEGEIAEESPAESVVREITELGGVAAANGASASDFDGVRDLVESTVEQFGRLDAVVNNAGILRDRVITSMTEDDFDAVIAVHVKGTFNLMKHACDYWRGIAKNGGAVSGRIINTTSGAGLWGNVGQTNYAAAKCAIAGMTLTVAQEMERYNVTANAISPLAYTRMTASAMGDYTPPEQGWDRRDPANASPVVAWLASEQSGWLTGAVLRIDGATVQRLNPWEIDPAAQYTSKGGERLSVDEIDLGLRKAYRLMPSGLPSNSIVARK
ncbi:MAG: SDR family NAD(P)-dependent oxidoreductase [Acidimicrobiia bacterium]